MNFSEPNHPPYGITQPRQLVRWLDVNAQNGPLTRARYNITIPPFSVTQPDFGTWQTSFITAVIDYEAPNNFSILDLSPLPVSPHYRLSISYTNSDRTVARYLLVDSKPTSGAQLPMLMDLPKYTNQMIKKNFRIEIWSYPSGTNAQATPIVLPTSVMQNLDYRYASDTNLVNADALKTPMFQTSVNLGAVGSVPIVLGNPPTINS